MPRRLIPILLMALFGTVGCVGTGPVPPPAAGTLRIVTYNVLKGTPALETAKALAPLHADVILLQEVDQNTRRSGGENQPEMLRQVLGMHAHYVPSWADDGGATGMMILSRYPLSETGRIPMKNWRTIAATATADVDGTPVHLCSVHLSAAWRLSLEHWRTIHAARLREGQRLIEVMDGWNGPTIVAGDFNMPCYFSRVRWMVTKRLADAAGRLWQPWPTHRAPLPLWRLDYVFVSDDIMPTYTTTRVACSDHLILIIDVKLPRG